MYFFISKCFSNACANSYFVINSNILGIFSLNLMSKVPKVTLNFLDQFVLNQNKVLKTLNHIAQFYFSIPNL